MFPYFWPDSKCFTARSTWMGTFPNVHQSVWLNPFSVQKFLHKINKDYISNFKFNFSWFWWIMSFLRNIEICFALKRSITKDAGAWWSAVNDPRLYVFLFPWMKDVLSQNLHGWCCLSRDCSCLLSLSSFFNTASSSKNLHLNIWNMRFMSEYNLSSHFPPCIILK